MFQLSCSTALPILPYFYQVKQKQAESGTKRTSKSTQPTARPDAPPCISRFIFCLSSSCRLQINWAKLLKFTTQVNKKESPIDHHGHLVELGRRADGAVNETEGESVGPVARDPAEAEEGHAEHDDEVDSAVGSIQ